MVVFSRPPNFPPDLERSTSGGIGSPLRVGFGLSDSKDLYLAMDAWTSGLTIANPGPFSMITLQQVVTTTSNNRYRRLQQRIADGLESGKEIWLETTFPSGDFSRTGSMILMRNAEVVDYDYSITGGSTPEVPTLTNPIIGSTLVVFAAATVSSLTHGFSTNGNLTELQQHVYAGSGAYTFPQGSILAIEENLPVGIISGRTLSLNNFADGLTVFGVIVKRKQ